MTTLTIELEGLRATVDVSTEKAWEIVRLAAGEGEKSKKVIVGGSIQTPTTPLLSRPDSPNLSLAAQIRDVAAEVLADGKFHPRREIAAAVRDCGLSVGNLDGALKSRFERNVNVEGAPIYRDPEKAPEPPPPPPARKPGEPGTRENPIVSTGGPKVLGRLGLNGGSPDDG